MFALAQFVGSPVLNSFGSGGVDYPTLALVVGWMLVAALVGSFLGILREHGRNHSHPVALPGARNVSLRHLSDESHQEAA